MRDKYINNQNRSMIQSLVDYVLERGHKDYGQFAHREANDPTSQIYNHRKLLAYLFQEDEQFQITSQKKLDKRISDLKLEQISGQLNYFSQKVHAELSKKHLILDGDLYKMQNEWLRKKMPDFYCYYFLKFAYANSYSRMHQLFLSELQNLNKQKDSYTVIKKTIQARQSCLSNLRRLVNSTKGIDVQQSLQTLREEREAKRKAKAAQKHSSFKHKDKDDEGGKSWRNQLQILFENINHLRKLSAYVVELVKMWRSSIYGISDDPRRFKERVIFYHNDANYLLKMLFDSNFLRDSFLNEYLTFNKHFDPFILKPALHLHHKQNRSDDEGIFIELITPNQLDMDKITKALVVLAQEEYDEDQQSRFINQRKNYGELQQRKQFIQRRRDTLGLKGNQSEKVLPGSSRTSRDPKVNKQAQNPVKIQSFSNDKKAGNTQRQLQQIKGERQQQIKKLKVQTSLNRLKQMRSIDLKKLSPYLSRNQRIEKAQKVIELQHKFRVAQSQYIQSVGKKKGKEKEIKKEIQVKEKIKQAIEINKESFNSKIFNRYIEENLKLMEESQKKTYLFKNKTKTNQQRISSSLNYHKISFHHRKEAEYQRNLQKYYPKQESPSRKELAQTQTKGTRAVIEISNKGIRSNEKIIEFELGNKKGKNLGQILTNRQRQIKNNLIKNSYEAGLDEKKPGENNTNLFDSEKQPQILIFRQQPQKLQEIKQFLYVKIKEQLLQEMKKNHQNKELQLNNMIEEEKRKKIEEIIGQSKKQEERKKQEQERLKQARYDRQRKQLTIDIRVEPIQYAQQNIDNFFNSVFSIDSMTHNRLFTAQKIDDLKTFITNQFYYIVLIGYHENQEVAYCIIHYQWQYGLHRKLVIDYLALKQTQFYMSTLYRICEYLWLHDPCQQIQMVMFKNQENQQGLKIVQDVQTYAERGGQVFEKQIYSNISEIRFVWMRPSHYSNLEFPYKNHYFGKLVNFKTELLSVSISLTQRHTPKIDMTLQVFTSYTFLLQELFRSYLTPEEVVQLRENSTNIRRLKDIFRIVLQLQKTNPIIDELTVVQGINLDDLYAKLKQKKMEPYDRYYWHHFYDKSTANRLLLAVLELKPELLYPIQSCSLNDHRYLRINPRQKILVLRSSVYSQQNIYILDTHIPAIKMFVMNGQHYKLMRIQLFVFLNLVFNNIVEDSQRFVNCIWVPQFAVCDREGGKEVKRITDFSITMKKSFFLSQEIYFANYQYIKSGISLLPKQGDVIFPESVIMGFMHTAVEQASTGMPIYGKLIDKAELF